MIVALSDAVVETCGGKVGALATLRRADLPVPDGFALPFAAYRSRPREADLLDELTRGLDTLGDVPVAVRSSASGEDTSETSAAGQYETVLAVRSVNAVAEAVRTCWASLHSERARKYRSPSSESEPPTEPAMAVLVQQQVDAEISGVLFTPGEPGGDTRIEASWGLGPSVVGGTVTPDHYLIDSAGHITRTIGAKRTRLDRHGSRLLSRDVPAGERDRPAIDDATARRLAELGQRAATLLGAPQDIEWAITDGNIHIVQARPVTAEPPPPQLASGALSSDWLTGTPASGGRSTGTARIVRGPRDFAAVRPGDILICPATDPAWTPLLRMAAGVVTEIGGVLCHAAIIAREQRIPAVVGVAGAMARLADGATLTLDGAAGTVTTE